MNDDFLNRIAIEILIVENVTPFLPMSITIFDYGDRVHRWSIHYQHSTMASIGNVFEATVVNRRCA